MVKQQVRIGKTNSNEAIIYQGLLKEDEVLLSIPENAENKKLVLLEKLKEEDTTQPITSIK